MTNNKNDKSAWIIGGSMLIGMGVGLFFIHKFPIAFVAYIFLGLVLGLMITDILSREWNGK